MRWTDFASTYCFEVRSHSKRARADGGVSLLRQIWELLRLILGPGKLIARDYYQLRVYRRDLIMSQKLKYISNRAINRTLPRDWEIVGKDKLLTYTVLSQQGFRTPEIYAIVHIGRQYKDKRSLRNSTDVIDFCCDRAKFPCVAKPIDGMFSHGVYVIEAVDKDLENVLFKNGAVQSLKQFGDELAGAKNGYMFQELLRPHPSITEICGNNLCTVRMATIFEGSNVRLCWTYWKIAVEPNMADAYWRKGNLLTFVDPEDGEVKHCSTGYGADYRSIEVHPVTQKAINGFKLPDWNEAVDQVLNASRAFPGIVMQGWDVALTDKGPLLLEVNIVGGMRLPQLAEQRGLYDGEFRAFIDRYRP